MSVDTIKLLQMTEQRLRQGALASVPSLMTEAEKRCCNCGTADVNYVCDLCRGAWYCSQPCADARAAAHKKLCYKFRYTKQTDSMRAMRAVYFPWDGPRPFVRFVGASTWAADIVYQSLVERTPSNTQIGCITISKNHMRDRDLSCTLKIIYRHWVDQQSDKNRKSVTMADFHSILDFFAFFGNRFRDPEMRPYLPLYPLSPPLPPVRGVVIHCEAMMRFAGLPQDCAWSPYTSVLMDSLDPILGHVMPALGDISELSVRCGMPLRLLRFQRPGIGTGVGGWDDISVSHRFNVHASLIMNAVGPINNIYTGDTINDVLVVRVDEGNLTVVQVAAMYEIAWGVIHGWRQATPNEFMQVAAHLLFLWGGDGAGPVLATTVPVHQMTMPVLEHQFLRSTRREARTVDKDPGHTSDIAEFRSFLYRVRRLAREVRGAQIRVSLEFDIANDGHYWPGDYR
ncbi:hypothetical protein B0T16DRAFT_392254 [Cercophora newfieldiana]|uniref:MYND-type domain-containing protein n=1 Tax=Cercophora newfieldiana TaxID=92897 RepID=A0AA39Y3D5_9PEZI|nr:hypothetical protein B0T16DRAFT_392254 [Cercophora newfieldiana]